MNLGTGHGARTSPRAEPVVERAGPADRAFLAMDSRDLPEQFGVILILDRAGELDLTRVRQLIAERIPAVPRLRQRLARTPIGCGGPIWIDDPGFDVCRQVRTVACPDPGDERALLDHRRPQPFPRSGYSRRRLAR